MLKFSNFFLIRLIIFSVIAITLMTCVTTYTYHLPVSYRSCEQFQSYAENCFLVEQSLKIHPVVGKGYALVIGIDDDNSLATEHLDKSVIEATQMAELLQKNGYAVNLLLDEQATRDNIIQTLICISNLSRSTDSFILFYSGHGLTLKDEEADRSNSAIDIISSDLKERYLYNTEYAECIGLTTKDIKNDFYMVCYQEHNKKQRSEESVCTFTSKGKYIQDQASEDTGMLSSLIGNHEILKLLSKANFNLKIELINACTGSRAKVIPPTPSFVYNYDHKRQGFLFMCMLNEKVLQGQFSSLIYDALKGDADANKDRVVSIFEIVNYSNARINKLLKYYGIVDMDMKYIIYCSEDIPLTAVIR